MALQFDPKSHWAVLLPLYYVLQWSRNKYINVCRWSKAVEKLWRDTVWVFWYIKNWIYSRTIWHLKKHTRVKFIHKVPLSQRSAGFSADRLDWVLCPWELKTAKIDFCHTAPIVVFFLSLFVCQLALLEDASWHCKLFSCGREGIIITQFWICGFHPIMLL